MMNLGRTGIKILDLRLDARDELYLLIKNEAISEPWQFWHKVT
jgi:hypothetical protein